MGSATSKVSRTAGSAARTYPKTPQSGVSLPKSAQSTTPSAAPAPASVKPPPRASGSRDDAINIDGSDPHFAQSLRSIGPVQPNPTSSPSSIAFAGNSTEGSRRPTGPHPTQNSVIAVLTARSQLQEAADKEFMETGRRGHEGRQFLDAFTIRNIVAQRDEHRRSPAEIERTLGLKAGVVGRLGPANIVSIVSESGRAQKGVEIV